ncbi:MAG: GNAT family N-acetyltransferase, partial [Bacteroidota bacterium]
VCYLRRMQLVWTFRSFEAFRPAELHAVLRLRQEVFIIEQQCIYLDADAKDLQSHHLFALDQTGRCQACLRIPAPGVSYDEPSIGRVATHPDVRRLGLGRELMQRGISAVRELYGHSPIRISAQCYLQVFYESFGFLALGHEYPEDGIPHIEMLYTP